MLTASRLLRSAPMHDPATERLPKLGTLSFVFRYVGAPERSLEPVEDMIDAGFSDATEVMMMWHASDAALRKTERFKALVRKAGIVEYWKARGWPDLCHPVSADDFACN